MRAFVKRRQFCSRYPKLMTLEKFRQLRRIPMIIPPGWNIKNGGVSPVEKKPKTLKELFGWIIQRH